MSPLSYSIVDFAKSLRADRCKIQNTPNLIFLCGGTIADSGPYRSFRDFFNRYLRKNKPTLAERVRLAEEVSTWYHKDDAFSDLLELEHYLAHLASVTVLFVESPGSIAELGAFATSDYLRPKTLAILNSSLGLGESFIADGPVRKLKNAGEGLVHYFPWDPNRLNASATKQEFGAISAHIPGVLETREKAHPKQVTFDRDRDDHTLLMVADLVQIAGAASQSDIAACLAHVGCTHASDKLGRYLSVLQSVGLIEKEPRADQIFFVQRSFHRLIRYRFQDGAVMRDRQRIQATIRRSLDSLKKAALASVLRKTRNTHKTKKLHV